MDSIVKYELNLDYVDAGMQFDKIFLNFKNEKEPRIYLYEFNSDTLKILEINCLTYDTDNDYCVEVTKGKEKFRMIKK